MCHHWLRAKLTARTVRIHGFTPLAAGALVGNILDRNTGVELVTWSTRPAPGQEWTEISFNVVPGLSGKEVVEVPEHRAGTFASGGRVVLASLTRDDYF